MGYKLDTTYSIDIKNLKPYYDISLNLPLISDMINHTLSFDFETTFIFLATDIEMSLYTNKFVTLASSKLVTEIDESKE